jgi:hypothetical protein
MSASKEPIDIPVRVHWFFGYNGQKAIVITLREFSGIFTTIPEQPKESTFPVNSAVQYSECRQCERSRQIFAQVLAPRPSEPRKNFRKK